MRLQALIAIALSLSTAAQAEIGSGSRSYTQRFDGESIRLYTYRPACSNPDILFIHHGASRNADDYRDYGKQLADRECMVVVAPEFSSSAFSNDEYQRGGIVGSNNRVLADSQWTTRLEELVIAWARKEVSGVPDLYLFGHSAGAQFLSRVAAYERPSGVKRFVVANPSTHVLPSLSEYAPYGFDRLGADAQERAALEAYLALPLTIYLGEDDVDRNDPDLASDAAAMRQCGQRRERGERTFAMGQQMARANGWTFNWRLVIAPDVAHSGSGMLRSSAADQAFGFEDEPTTCR